MPSLLHHSAHRHLHTLFLPGRQLAHSHFFFFFFWLFVHLYLVIWFVVDLRLVYLVGLICLLHLRLHFLCLARCYGYVCTFGYVIWLFGRLRWFDVYLCCCLRSHLILFVVGLDFVTPRSHTRSRFTFTFTFGCLRLWLLLRCLFVCCCWLLLLLLLLLLLIVWLVYDMIFVFLILIIKFIDVPFSMLPHFRAALPHRARHYHFPRRIPLPTATVTTRRTMRPACHLPSFARLPATLYIPTHTGSLLP